MKVELMEHVPCTVCIIFIVIDDHDTKAIYRVHEIHKVEVAMLLVLLLCLKNLRHQWLFIEEQHMICGVCSLSISAALHL